MTACQILGLDNSIKINWALEQIEVAQQFVIVM